MAEASLEQACNQIEVYLLNDVICLLRADGKYDKSQQEGQEIQ